MTTWALHSPLDLDACNLRLPAFEGAGLLGMVEQDGATTLYFAERVDEVPIPGRWEAIADTDWNAAWRASIAPVVVGRVAVHPPWLEPPAVEVPLAIEPAQAFGTGHHETTAACLTALQELPLDGRRVLDVGTGTGVLALAALRLGAASAVGVDTDPVAVATASANAVANGLALDVREGSTEAVAGDSFDLVVANLDTATVSALAGDLTRALARDGVLVVSGVSVERLDTVLGVLTAAGLVTDARPGVEWALVLARHG